MRLHACLYFTSVIYHFRYNGFLPAGDRGRRRSKFVLQRRTAGNGVRRSRHYVVRTPHSSQAILDATQHSISYTLSRNHAVIVEYTEDDSTDMFQVPYQARFTPSLPHEFISTIDVDDFTLRFSVLTSYFANVL